MPLPKNSESLSNAGIVLRDFLLEDGFSLDQAERAVASMKHMLESIYKEKHVEDLRARIIPPELKTKKQRIKWCEENGGHVDSGGMFYASCAICDWEENI